MFSPAQLIAFSVTSSQLDTSSDPEVKELGSFLLAKLVEDTRWLRELVRGHDKMPEHHLRRQRKIPKITSDEKLKERGPYSFYESD